MAPFAALAVALCLPASASAQKCIARPGTAALDQYCETVPTDRGETPARPTDDSLRSKLAADDVCRLERHGKDGAAVLALPGGPKPPSTPSRGSRLSPTPPQASPRPAETDAPPGAPSANPFAVVFDALGGLGTLGWGVVLTLALLGVAAAASAARAVRSSGA